MIVVVQVELGQQVGAGIAIASTGAGAWGGLTTELGKQRFDVIRIAP